MGELLKIHANGQWTLEKNWKPKDIKSVDKWADTGMRNHIEKVPPATGKLKNNMLGSLGMQTQSRINPTSNQREYKLFRAAPVGDKYHEKAMTSWTAAPDFAYYWAHNNMTPIDEKDAKESPRKPHQVMHAWVPEEHIHSYLTPTLESLNHDKASEHEVMVMPHKVNVEQSHKGEALEAELANVKKRNPGAF